MGHGKEASNAAGAQHRAPTKGLSGILLASIAELAGAGEVEKACRFAGQACVSLRNTVQRRRADLMRCCTDSHLRSSGEDHGSTCVPGRGDYLELFGTCLGHRL